MHRNIRKNVDLCGGREAILVPATIRQTVHSRVYELTPSTSFNVWLRTSTLGVKGGDGIIGAIGPIMRGEIKKSGQSAALRQKGHLSLITLA